MAQGDEGLAASVFIGIRATFSRTAVQDREHGGLPANHLLDRP